MKLAIVGTKNNIEYSVIEEAIAASGYKPKEIVSTGEKGVAELASLYAKYSKIKYKEMKADWADLTAIGAVVKSGSWGNDYNSRAGVDRDQKMLSYVDSVLVIEPDGDKNFTEMAARKLGKKVFVYNGTVDQDEIVNF